MILGTQNLLSTARNGLPDANVLVIFGIIGDVATVMKLHALYHLEQRCVLNCPIVDVAAIVSAVNELRERCRL
jgi:glucose-6-phosphate 1-dehydrogenase